MFNEEITREEKKLRNALLILDIIGTIVECVAIIVLLCWSISMLNMPNMITHGVLAMMCVIILLCKFIANLRDPNKHMITALFKQRKENR